MRSLSFNKIVKTFGKRKVLADVAVSLVPGECQLLCGDNGAGKSTLLRILAGMERPDSVQIRCGEIQSSWRDTKARLLTDCIYLHQRPYLFEGSVRYNLAYPLRGRRAVRNAMVKQALEWSGMTAIADQSVDKLSGGERQRVALMRAWLRQPEVMLLDEPTANMDIGCRQRTVELLNALKQEGVALVMATHDPNHFAGLADRTLRLVDGFSQVEVWTAPDKPLAVPPGEPRVRIVAG